MTQDNNKQAARNNRKSGATSGLYSAGFLIFLFLLLVSVGANKSLTNDNEQAGGGQKRDTPHQVKILFNGLFYFSFPRGTPESQFRSHCRVGILSTRQDHMLYFVYKDSSDTKVLIFPHPALQRLPGNIEINKNPPDTGGVTIEGGFTPDGGWGEPNRNMPQQNPNYFNWILDFEGRSLHDDDLDEKSDKLRPALLIKTGIFGTENLSDPYKYYTIQNGVIANFGYVASTIRDVITLNSSEQLVIKVGGNDFCLPIDTTEIQLNNVRPNHAKHLLGQKIMPAGQPIASDYDDLPDRDDLQLYYDDLFVVSSSKRFHFIPTKTGRRAVPFICFASGGSKY